MNIDTIKNFFFEAMQFMYLSEKPERKTRLVRAPQFPGRTVLTYKSERFDRSKARRITLNAGTTTIYEYKSDHDLLFCTDVYCTSNKAKRIIWSAGTTTIYDNLKPIWVMQYRGWYVKKAIPFLKHVLKTAYAEKKFCGGRGPQIFEHAEYPGFTYINDIHNGGGDFSQCNGEEQIVSIVRKQNAMKHIRFSYHEYWCKSFS